MGNVNYYLKPAAPGSGRSLIYLKFKYGGKVLVYSFGQTVKPSNWNTNLKRVKGNKETTADGQHSLNDLLDALQRVCLQAYNKELVNGIPSTAVLKKHLDDFFRKNSGTDPAKPTLFILIDRFISGEIKSQGKDKSKGTLQNYSAVKLHLKEFEKKTKLPVTFEAIDLDFFYKYTSFLKHTLNLAPNTVAKDIRLLKVFLAEAIDLGYTSNLQFKHKKFTIAGEETDAVYLTEKEVINLYRFDLSNTKRLEQVRDLFVFGCFSGLRFSDYSEVRRENIVQIDGDHFIKMVTKKTQDLVIIPCNPIIMEIMQKYDDNHNRLPKSLSNQKFNAYIKEVCQIAGLNETGRLSTDPIKTLAECVSSHTARRSFATNYYLEGFPTIDLMKITGHRTEKAFMKYIRVTKLDTAKRLSEHIKKNWSGKLMKVAS
jgi:integrase